MSQKKKLRMMMMMMMMMITMMMMMMMMMMMTMMTIIMMMMMVIMMMMMTIIMTARHIHKAFFDTHKHGFQIGKVYMPQDKVERLAVSKISRRALCVTVTTC